MELEEAIKVALEGQAVLFAGAGFSFGAKNKYGKMPQAKEIKNILLKELGKADSEYGLEVISQLYKNKKSEEELVEILKDQFNIYSVAKHHQKIMNIQWKRIYTTNYDQVIEKASMECPKKIRRDAVILSDDFENTDKSSICVHINGFIQNLDSASLDRDFKLTDKSYSCESLVDNEWFQFLVNDFSSAAAIIVIGYSMQFDIDIKRLFSSPEISRKVVFIEKNDIDEIALELLESYGKCYNIGIEGFSDLLETEQKSFVPSIEHIYKSFKCMYRDPLEATVPNYETIVQLYMEGILKDDLLMKDGSGAYSYLLARNASYPFLRAYRNKKVHIAIANLGNGKSVFCKMIENELRREEVKVFTYIHRYDSLDEEIEKICEERKRCVVIIDNYPGHMDILNKFALYGHKNISFLLTARNGVNQMFCKQLERALKIQTEDIAPLYLNKLQDNEIDDLAFLLENNSLLSLAAIEDDESTKEFLLTTCEGKFSNLLLKIFNSNDIKRKLTDLYTQLCNHNNRKIKEVAIFSLLKNVSNYDIDFPEILDLLEADYVAFKKNDIEFLSEVFDSNENNINVRSSIISHVLLRDVVKIDEVVTVMKSVFLAADRKKGRVYYELQRAMVSHSQFTIFSDDTKDKQQLQLISTFYDEIRNTQFAKANPFFWEQFASAYIDLKKYDMVKKCIDNALLEAKKIDHFVPFQIMTVFGRYYAEKAYDDVLKNKLNADEAIASIKSSVDAILMFYDNPDNNLYYVFKVVKMFPKIFWLIKEDITPTDLSIYIEKNSIMRKKMEIYVQDCDYQYQFKVKEWMKDLNDSLDEAKKLMKRTV